MNHRAGLAWLTAAGFVMGWPVPAAAGAGAGESAPAFSLPDQDGRTRSLSDFRGKFVVLEWFNNDCPFVRKHYGSGNMQGLQAAYTGRGVVWLTIASSAPGRQGHVSAEEARAIIAHRDARQTALLLDPDGAVGRRYGAKTTPHMFVINPEGVVIYKGAIDDRPSADPADIDGAVNYVQQALEDAMAGGPVTVADTTPYGCSVKY
jgi:peroxiredoxin